MFKGSIVAIITPFKDEKVDEKTLAELVEFQIKNGTHGIVPCGTTGESPTLDPQEHGRVIQICAEVANKRVPILAGTGSNSTAEAIKYSQHAQAVGADGCLVVTPYYNKPTQKGLYLHFKAVAENIDIPIVLYNIEGRCARNIETETVAKLAADCKNIIGVKEASGNLEQVKAVRAATPDEFTILSGDDALTLQMMDLGGSGVVSVIANLVPQDVVAMIDAYNSGNKDTANEINDKLTPLVKSMFVETNPIPVKKASQMLDMTTGEVRLPLCNMEDENVEKLRAALEDYGLLTTAKG